ncbi:hypothetical protein Tco_0692325 [Tanacetum coccineum]
MSNTNNTMQTQTSNAHHNNRVSLCSISKVQEKAQLSKEGCMKSLKALQSHFTFLTDTLKDLEHIQKHATLDAQSLKDTMIRDMDSIEKYMLEIILHQQEIQQMLNKKKLMQTQEDQSNTFQALKVDLVVIQNTCSGKENSNSETALNKSVKDCSLDSETKDVHPIKYKMSKAKERCMTYFRCLHSHLQVLSKEDLKGTRIEHGFKWAFMSLFGQDDDTFTSTMFLNVDQLQKQLDKDKFQEDVSMEALWVVNRQFQKFINSQFSLDYDSLMINKYFAEYTRIEVKQFRDTLLQYMGNVKKYVAERTRHQRQYDRRMNKRQMQTTNSTVQDKSSKSGNDTYADNADIRPIYDEEPMAKVGVVAEKTTSLLANNADLKAQIQEKVFAIAALKNDLITQHYFPKRREYAFAKPNHMIASSSSRNSSKNMPRFSSNDMVHNHYLEDAKTKTQERNRNSKSSVMHTASLQNNTKGSKPKPRSNNKTPRSLSVSKSSCVTITVLPKADHSKKY